MPKPTPILVLIDIQREYTTPGRPFYLRGIEASLATCSVLLQHARSIGWGVVHVRHEQEREPFKAGSEFTSFASGFDPADGETVFTKHLLSAFSNDDFASFALRAKAEARPLILIGYGGTMCCLSTALDGMHRGVRTRWVYDASLSRPSQLASEAGVHRHLTEMMRIYADVVSSAELLRGSAVEPAGAGAQ
jgi:ureidoacrylate peracid hydrolase